MVVDTVEGAMVVVETTRINVTSSNVTMISAVDTIAATIIVGTTVAMAVVDDTIRRTMVVEIKVRGRSAKSAAKKDTHH
jgi:hypothetical protein